MTTRAISLQILDAYLAMGIDTAMESCPTVKAGASLRVLPSKKKQGPVIPSTVVDEKPAATPLFKEVQENSCAPGAPSLDDVTSLEKLREVMVSFEGCDLKKTALHTVFSRGNPKASIMVVGEAPGADEDRLGQPFVGLSGQLLDLMLSTIGLGPDHFYVTNILPWRPPGNRQPTPDETRLCLPFVKKHIALVAPKILLFVGGTSAKALMGTTTGIMALRGKWTRYDDKIEALALFHPAYLLRSPGQKQAMWQDLLLLKKKIHALEIPIGDAL